MNYFEYVLQNNIIYFLAYPYFYSKNDNKDIPDTTLAHSVDQFVLKHQPHGIQSVKCQLQTGKWPTDQNSCDFHAVVYWSLFEQGRKWLSD